jgi:hypothetical protein
MLDVADVAILLILHGLYPGDRTTGKGVNGSAAQGDGSETPCKLSDVGAIEAARGNCDGNIPTAFPLLTR